MKSIFKTLIAFAGMSLLLAGCNQGQTTTTGSTSTGTSTTTSTSASTSGQPDPNYYSGISDSLSGESLRKALQSLNWSKISDRAKGFVYDSLRPLFQYVDRATDTPSGKIVGFYNNEIMDGKWNSGTVWNREHCWPKSKSGNLVENDLHMVRPASVSINEGRSNYAYGSGSGNYDPAEEGVAEYRGICARIIFYCAMKVDELSSVSKINTAGILTDMLRWNLQYPPLKSDSGSLALRVEWNRNNLIETHKQAQGNRNPFIDHPEYACKIWGNTNSQTKQICGM